MCADCGAKTSATAGTIFHRSHTPLSTRFRGDLVRHLAEEQGLGRGLQDALGFGSYETAWAWLHKLRQAMGATGTQLLRGVVELDQSFLGGRSHGGLGKVNREGADPDRRRAVAQRLRAGRARLDLAEVPNGLDQVEFARDVIAPGTEIHTDGAWVLTRLGDHGFTSPHPGLPGHRPGRGRARTAPGLLAAQTVDSRHPATDQPATAALLPRRVHLPVQPADLPASARGCCSGSAVQQAMQH